MSNYTENKTPNLIINTLEDPSKLSGITVGENEIILVPDETEEELAKKVDKTSTASQIYGTDENGDQTTYNKSDFQDKLTAGTNITIDENNVISSTAQESFFRGRWANWSLVPSNGNEYPEDYHGNRKPTDNDFMVLSEASDYVNPSSLTHQFTVINIHSTKAFTIKFIDEYGTEYEYYYSSYNNKWVQINEYYSLQYIPGVPGRWYIRTNKSEDTHIVVNGIEYEVDPTGSTVSAGALVSSTADTTPTTGGLSSKVGQYQGAWRFVYHGAWDTNGKLGWTPQYQIENTLPIATDTVAGIAKLYNTTGSNTDGSMTQKSITDALDSKLDKSSEIEKVYGTDGNGNQVVYSAGNNIEFYNKSPQVFHGEEGKTYTEVNSLKSEDGQYIDTNLGYSSNQKGPTYDITFRYISIEGGSSYNGAVFGARAITGYWGIGIDSFGGKLRIVHGGDNIYNVIDKDTDTNWHRVYSTYDLNADGGTTYYYYDDELVFQTTKQFTTSDLTMVVFGKRSEDSVSVDSPIEIGSFKWYDDSGNALLDYVPAVSSTGEAGFYDKVSGEFKVSASGTSPEVEPYVEEHKINATAPVVFRRIIEE